MLLKIKKYLKKKVKIHREKNIFYLTALIHILKYIFNKKFRKDRCIIDPSEGFFYKYRKTFRIFLSPTCLNW